jgi:hypothetical protein
MIQRIQSLYLLIVTVMMSFLLMWPYAGILLPNEGSIVFYVFKLKQYIPGEGYSTYQITIFYLLLVLISGALSFFTIFLFTRRPLQIRICYLNMLFLIVLTALLLLKYIQVLRGTDSLHHSFKLGSLYPIIAIISNFFAIRAIEHDEMIVQSYNRMR